MKLDAKMILNTRIPRFNMKLLFSSSISNFDHYTILGISKSASQDKIDEAYFKKLEELKPVPGLMKESISNVLDAYETLSDKDSREKYDQSISICADEIQQIVKNTTQQQPVEQRGLFVSQGVRKMAEDEQMGVDKINWAYKIIMSMFLIVTVPKVAYIAYYYIVNGVSPF